VSFIVADKPWLAGEYIPQKILGEHYFGDFQSMMVWTRINAPYLESYPERSNLLPSSRIFLYPFFYFPLKVSFILYVILTAAILVYAVKELLNYLGKGSVQKISQFQTIIFIILIFVFSHPLLMDLDRGNFYTVCISLLIVSIIKLRSNKLVTGLLIIFIVISIKSFLIFAVLPFLPWKKYRTLIFSSAGFLICNIFVIFTYKTSFFSVAKNLYLAQTRYLGKDFIAYLMNNASLASSVSRIHEYIFGTNATVVYITNHFTILKTIDFIYLIVALLIAFKASRFEVKLFFALSTISFAASNATWCAESWASFALLALIYRENVCKSDKFFKATVLIVSWCLLVPTWVQLPVPGTRYNQQLLICPVIAFICALTFVPREFPALNLKKVWLQPKQK
jgi:hypothetical protein